MTIWTMSIIEGETVLEIYRNSDNKIFISMGEDPTDMTGQHICPKCRRRNKSKG